MTRREVLLAALWPAGFLWPAWMRPRPRWEAESVVVAHEPHQVLVTLRARRDGEMEASTVAVTAWEGGPPLTEAERTRAEALGRELVGRWLADRNRRPSGG